MSVDTAYSAIPYIYKSRGLNARPIEDQAPEFVYIQLMNCLEREENAMSSRLGTQIINRDPAGTGTSNYFFTAPVTSLAKLNYQSNAYRYAGLSDGSLWRRTGNTQGAYTKLTLPTTINGATVVLSGETFTSKVNNCFETSQAYLFIYDAAASIKDSGTGNPQLTGIDPPPYTANALPYSPLLTLIDNFASGNSYTTTGFTTTWAHTPITTLDAAYLSTPVDFPQFTATSSTGAEIPGGSVTAASGNDGITQSTVISGFPSVSIPVDSVVNVSIPVQETGTATHAFNYFAGAQACVINYYYSINGGTTWVLFGTDVGPNTAPAGPYIFPLANYTWNFTVTGLTNLNEFQVKVAMTVRYDSDPTLLTCTATVLSVNASVPLSGVFGLISNGMLSVLNTNTSISVPIASVASSGLTSGVYTTLTITTTAAHGLTGTPPISIYGSSNDLVDGFYTATVTGTNTLTVPYYSVNAIGATGGFLNGGAAAPAECILANEYSTPYPTQFSAWGFYQQVPIATAAFPIGCWVGKVATNTTATVGVTADFDLSINNQVASGDLIVLTLQVGSPANIANIRLQFDVNGSDYTSSYYYANISPSYYQGNIANVESAYDTTENQILADTLGLITGQPAFTTTAQLQPSNFSTGSDSWVAVYIPRGNFLPVGSAGQSGLDWTNITGWQLVIETLDTAVTGDGSSTVACNGLYLQWGYGPSSFAGVGYDYRYTFYDANTGTESSPSDEMAFNETFGYLSSLSAPFYLRQAVQVTGYYSFDPQVTHVRVYRRGGTYNDNWRQIDQIPNITSGGLFYYKDVIADQFIAQAQLLVLDNDPPVTSSLLNPIQTTLSAATTGPGNSCYSTYGPQSITVTESGAVFVPNQLVEIGNSNNVEVVSVIAGGVGTFTTIVRLQHNAGEPVNVYAVPRQPCNLCAEAYGQMWLAGDENNPHYLYYSKPGLPENFGPQNYIPVGTPNAPITIVVNWRGTLFVATTETWWIIPGSQRPPQPTGSIHGAVAQSGWIEAEGAIYYRASDGWREFTGAEGVYKTLPVEWIFRGDPQCLPPEADPAQASQDVFAYYNNLIIGSYISLNSSQRYRLIWDTVYQRFRQDDVAATAMLWEKDTNVLLVGKEISTGNYAVVQDQIGDYDDGGWVSGALVQTPINLTIQHPYRDIGKPHDLKQYNMLETDINTQGQDLNTTMLFEDGTISIVLATQNTGTSRSKCEMIVTGSDQPEGGGQQAYRASILHTMAVTAAPTLYQEAVHVALLPEERASYDTYWIKFGTDQSKFIKQGYFDYTSPVDLACSLYADGSTTPYWTFTLPAAASRAVVRVRFGNLNAGTTAFTMRTWRLIVLTTSETDPLQEFLWWAKPRIEWKPIGQNSYQIKELEE